MKNLAIVSIVVFGVLSRFLPHLPNMTAIGGMVLFSGATLRPRTLGVLLPGLVVFASDLFLGWHNTIWFTLGAWISLAAISSIVLQKFSWKKLAGMSVFASLWFFLVTNFGFWMTSGAYPMNAGGLAESYIAGLPFLGQDMLGNIIFSAAIFAFWIYLAEPFALTMSERKS